MPSMWQLSVSLWYHMPPISTWTWRSGFARNSLALPAPSNSCLLSQGSYQAPPPPGEVPLLQANIGPRATPLTSWGHGVQLFYPPDVNTLRGSHLTCISLPSAYHNIGSQSRHILKTWVCLALQKVLIHIKYLQTPLYGNRSFSVSDL